MSSISDFHRNLYRLYEHYVGEPDSRKDVYGYWLFILGYIVGSAGVFTFVVGYAVVDGTMTENTLIKVAGVAAATGLALCLFGIGLMLPVRKRGIQASVFGLFISLIGVASYGALYPANWRERGMGMDAEVIAVYTTGIAIIAGVTALVPVVTGRKGMFVEEEGSTEDPDILTGEATEGAQFAVFRDENGNWKWHVLHLTALAESTDSAVTQPETTEQIERVQSKISSAGLMELTTSAFRLYEDRDGSWQWTLARDDGSVVGDCAHEFDERDAAEKSVSFLKDHGPDADVIEIDTAAFTYTEERDRWRWHLVDDDRTPLASSESDYPSRERAEAAARTFTERFDRARLLDIEHVGVELYEREGGWTWQLIDDSDDVIATCTDEFGSRRDAEEAVEALLPALESASITVAGEPTYERYRSGEEWRWRLVDGSEHVIGRTPEGRPDRRGVERESERFGEHALEADVVEIEDAEYEVYPADGTAGTDATLPVTAETDGGAETEAKTGTEPATGGVDEAATAEATD